MKKTLLLLLLPLILTCCTRIVKIDNTGEYTARYYEPLYANGFEIRSLPGDSSRLLLEVYRPDTMSIMIPRGGFNSVLCMSSTYVGALASLDERDKIVAVSRRDLLTDPFVKANTVDVGYDGAMDYETLLAAKPDIALIYGIGGHSAIEAKLEELSVPYVYINDFEEQNPLGRAEWIVALGAIVGTDGRAFFNHVAESYIPVEGNTKVMLNAPYSGSWFIPGKENYMSRLLADAGATITAPQNQGVQSGTIDLEEALPALKAAEIWLSPGQASTLSELKAMVPQAEFSGAVWNQTPDMYESGASRPDVMLAELQALVNGTAPDSMRYFYRLR